MIRSERGVLACLVIAAALGCGDEDEPAQKVTFTEDIHPILQMNCASGSGCHGEAGFLPGHADPDVDVAYMEVTRAASGGRPVYEVILVRTASTDPGFVMPPNYNSPPCNGGLGNSGCLTQEQYDLIKTWVDQGHLK
jgi:hypothetical protein